MKYQPSIEEIYEAERIMTLDQDWATMVRERDFYKETPILFAEDYAEIKEETKDIFSWSGTVNDSLTDVGSMMIAIHNQNLFVEDKRSGEMFNVKIDNTTSGGHTFSAGIRVTRAVLALDGGTMQMTAKFGNIDYLKVWTQKVLYERRENH
jgi:hypothetical protein